MRTTRLLASTVLAAVAASILAPTAAEAGSSARRADPYEVTLKSSTSELVSGKTVTLKGKVEPGAKGAEVVLQQKGGGNPWKQVDSTTLNKRGKFEFTDTPQTMTAREYRVIKPASGKHAKGVSDPVTVTIYQWHELAQLQARSSEFVSQTTVSMAGDDYTHSYVGLFSEERNTAAVDWNINGDCLKLKATYGMDDVVDEGVAGQIDVIADGDNLHSQSVAFPSAYSSTLDISDVFRLGFDFTGVTADARPGVGTPRVLCSF